MAHLTLLSDADPAHRRQFEAGVRWLFEELPGTAIGAASAGPVTCLWAAGPRAPIDLQRGRDQFAVLIGYAIDDAGHWMTARDLAETSLAEAGTDPAHDGYHVGVTFDPARGLTVSVDPLGLFPLYHAPLPDGGFMVSTTPQAFLAHPRFRWSVDREGLAGILLAHGLLADRPLLAGVRRLPTGHLLRARPGQALAEDRVFEFAGSPPPPGETPLETRERIGDLLLATLRRHRPPGDDTVLMLSGGLDSRLIAGSLADLGIPTRAVTFGRPHDYEVLAAVAVAARLGMPIERISTEEADASFLARSRQSVRFNHLSSGPGGDDFAAGLGQAATSARFNWSGIPFDWVFEPVSRHNGYDPDTDTWSFSTLLAHLNAWGVPYRLLPRLLGSDGELLCGDVLAKLRLMCTNGPLPPERRSAQARWDQRVRNHLAAALHQTSFQAWPLLPAIDRRLFAAVFGLAVPTFADRSLEKAIMISRRPDLATIPLDTNSFRFEPLLATGRPPGPIGRAARSLLQRVRRATAGYLPGTDPRRYERLFDVNQPRWRAVRRAAEPLRPLLTDHLDGPTLAELLPPPDRRIRSRSPLQAGSPIRLLCGLAFVLDQSGLRGAVEKASAEDKRECSPG